MTQWDYRLVTLTPLRGFEKHRGAHVTESAGEYQANIDEFLAALGSEGWQLAGMVSPVTGSLSFNCIFTRPRAGT
jgi:hypothetical protein